MESTATTNHEVEFPTIGGMEEAYPGKITSLIMVPPPPGNWDPEFLVGSYTHLHDTPSPKLSLLGLIRPRQSEATGVFIFLSPRFQISLGVGGGGGAEKEARY